MIAGVDSVRRNGKLIANFETRTAVNYQTYFVLKATNGEIIGTSETYTTPAAKDNGIQAIISTLSATVEVEQVDQIADDTNGVFELFTDVKSQTRFRLKSPNGEIILQSEGYTSKAGALNGIDSVRTNAPLYNQFDLKDPSSNSQYWFTLKAPNNEIIGQSEMYKTRGGRANGVYAVQRVAPTARFVDYTVLAASASLTPKIQIVQSYGIYQFIVRNARGNVVFSSYGYKDLKSAQDAIPKFQADAKTVSASLSGNYAVYGSYGSTLASGYDAAAFTTELRAVLTTATVENISQAPTRRARFTMFCGKTSGIYWNLKAANNEIILASENYKSRASAKKGIASVVANVKLPADVLAEDPAIPSSFRQLVARDQSPYFTLVATNGRTIGVSETYSSAGARDNGIYSVTRNAPIADTIDEAFGCKLKDLPKYPTGFSYDDVNKQYREDELAAETDTGVAPSSASSLALSALAALAALAML
jgi:uncharacterized protein YegP (UPF0339 family)